MLSRGGLVVLCFRSFVFTVAPKALPCVGCCYPLHHFGTFLRCSALPHWGIHHWCSGSPFGRPLRHLSTRSGPCVPFLPLSAAASRLLCLPSLCGLFLCPCLVLPPLLCPPLPVSASLAFLCVRPVSVPPCLWSLVLRFVSLCRCFGLLPLCWIRLFLIGATQLLWSLAVSLPPLVLFLPLRFWPEWSLCSWLCVGGPPVLFRLWGGLIGEVGPALEPWTGLHCSELHWRWPVELPALLSRAPASSKACPHGSFSTDAAVLRIWHFVMSAPHLLTLLRFFTGSLALTAFCK